MPQPALLQLFTSWLYISILLGSKLTACPSVHDRCSLDRRLHCQSFLRFGNLRWVVRGLSSVAEEDFEYLILLPSPLWLYPWIKQYWGGGAFKSRALCFLSRQGLYWLSPMIALLDFSLWSYWTGGQEILILLLLCTQRKQKNNSHACSIFFCLTR